MSESPSGPADLEIGAFSDDAPWIIDPEQLSWRPVVATIRDLTRRQLPALLAPARLPPAGRLSLVLGRFGHALVGWHRFERRSGDRSISRAGLSRRTRLAIEALGPTFIKLAQIISGGEGLFPDELVSEFKKCRDQVPPERFSTVRSVVEADLGQPLESVFAEFDPEPLASASIAQVHAARLRSGESVVVKVQRPQVQSLVQRDIEVMAWIAPFLVGRIPVTALANPPALVELFAQTIAEELDFRLEAENMLEVAQSFAQLGQRGYVIPRPHPTLVTRRVLVMERLDGFAFDDVVGMRDAGIDTEAIVRTGMIGFMEGCMLHGLFHGDLHGGNLFILPDGRTALLDFGITARMDDRRRQAFLRLLLTAMTNNVTGQVAALRDLGALPPDTDLEAVIADLGLDRAPIDPTTLTPDELIAEIQSVVKSLVVYGARMPKELMLFVKNLVFLDGAIARLAPDLDLFAEITHIAMYFASTHGDTIARDVGIDPRNVDLDLSGVKAGFGVDPDQVTTMTYRDLQERRELIRERFRRRGAEAR
ncbi:MAG: ABC1 kinase family protein [Acidimicrobiales bacterium]